MKISFLTFNKTNLQFAKKKFIKKSYSTAKALSIIKWVEIINKKDFILAVLSLENKIFVKHIIFFIKLVYPSRKTLIINLDMKKVTVFTKYLSFANVIFFKFIAILPKHFKINIYFINLKNDKQLSYKLMYSLKLVKLETLEI